jgi:hypothetical protein
MMGWMSGPLASREVRCATIGLQDVADRDRAKREREVAQGRSCLLSLIKFMVWAFVVLYVFVSVIGILYPS